MGYRVDLRQIQEPLKARYRSEPDSARIVTGASTVACDLQEPRKCAVSPHGFESMVIRSGLHPAAGGTGEEPCSGDILAAALAICEESTLRSVAANIGLELESLKVDVEIDWDFRGTMGVDRTVPVGATGIRLKTRVKVKDGVDPERARRLLASAERYCSTLQTLRHGVDVVTDFAIEG